MKNETNFNLIFSINDWFYWGDVFYDNTTRKDKENQISNNHKQYDLSDIPLLQRRRLPEVAKRIHEYVKQMAAQNIPIIYASYNGEISQTLSIIRSFSDDVSPAKFSLSVHNAIAGLLSVVHKNTLSYQTIDSQSGLVETAIVEALGLLTQYEKVAIVYYDERLPDELSASQSHENKEPFSHHNSDKAGSADAEKEQSMTQVLALTITSGQDYQLQKQWLKNRAAPDRIFSEFNCITKIGQFLNNQDADLHTRYANSIWHWSRHAS